MEAIALQADIYGRRRTTNFIAIMDPNLDREEVQEQAITLYHGSRQLLCMGTLPIQANGSLYPFNNAAPANLPLVTVLFCLKKYSSNIRLTIYANNLDFCTGADPDVVMIWSATRIGRSDFILALIRRLMKNPYEAVDSNGNKLSLAAQIAEKTQKNNTKIITELIGQKIRTYQDAKAKAPVLAFYHEVKIRRMIRIAENEEVRNRNQPGFREIQINEQDYDPQTQAVYSRIVHFQNRKLVLRSNAKRLSGLYLQSNGTSIGKSSLLNTIKELVLCYNHCLTDLGWQEAYDLDAKNEQAYKCYMIDAFNDTTNYDFSSLEKLCDSSVKLKRRGLPHGELPRGTPFVISSNLPPQDLLNIFTARIFKARALSVNCTGVLLFKLINIIRALHGLDPFEPINEDVPSDLE